VAFAVVTDDGQNEKVTVTLANVLVADAVAVVVYYHIVQVMITMSVLTSL
jgi:hypothetical protein